MNLLVKFNLVFLLLFLVGIGACGYFSWELLQKNAREEIAENARLLMANAIAVRGYTNTRIKPLLETQMRYTFLPESVPAFSATEVLNELRKKYPEYAYKEAMLNPTNPRDRAVEWEADIINQFRNGSDSELFGVRDTPTGRSLFFARPLKITDPACLVCHSTVEVAPRTMVDKYGTANGFGWNFNETVGAQVVSVPTDVPFARARKAFIAFMTSLAGVLVAIGLILNLLLWWMFIRPVTRISALANRVSLGALDAPDFNVRSGDEIQTLSESLARMRKSLVQAMKMLET
ncbi:HAMP domain protein [Burkholderiales bacterium]|jgi:protein-histidine pros-kinase|nr:HAMP domain protein [Burkholderiales bacterium]